jgi:hypothetical protein
MSQSGYTPIQLYHSSTTGNTPLAGNLTDGELAINTADGVLFYKDSGGVVRTLASKNAASGAFTTLSASSTVSGTGFSNYLASPPSIGNTAANTGAFTTLSATSLTNTALTSGRITFASTGGLLSDSSSLTWNGSVLGATNFSGALNGTVGATTPNTGAFTTLSASGQLTLTNASNYNLYASGAGANYLAGSLGVGSTSWFSDSQISAGGNVSLGASPKMFHAVGAFQSGSTTDAASFRSSPAIVNSVFTLPTLYHFAATQGIYGASATLTNQHAFYASGALTGAINNYGFYGAIAAGTGRYNLYMAGTADNWFNGSLIVNGANYVARNSSGQAATVRGIRFDIDGTTYGRVWCPNGQSLAIQAGSGTLTDAVTVSQTGTVGIGATPVAGVSFLNAKTISGASFSYGNWTSATVDSTVTNAFVNSTNIGTQATAFTLSGLYHYRSSQGSFGAGSTVTTQYGHYADASLTGATNNYGFYGVIAAATGRYNFYAAGTADNQFSGNVLIFGAGGLGYTTGSGGAVTQATSRTTGVTLNKTNGAITLVSAAGLATYQSFTVTNSTVAATDTIIINQKSGTDIYEVFITAVAAGSFRVTFATTGGVTVEQPVFNFSVIKAVTA